MIDPASATWGAVVAHCKRNIDEARDRLETAGLDAVQTERERGKIAAYREIMSLVRERRLDQMAESARYDV